MNILSAIRSVVTECVKVITFGAKLQGGARADLIAALQEICDNFENAHIQVKARLLPVKSAGKDAARLAQELRSFAADPATREAFKPEHICGRIDGLLDAFASNLDPLKYAVDVQRIGAIKEQLHQIGNFDRSIRAQYDQFTQALDRLAYELESAPDTEQADLVAYARRIVEDFENELTRTIDCVRDAKQQIVR